MIDIHKVPVVYFAGGMKTGWPARVREAVPGVIYIDPSESGLKDEKAYTAYDLAGVERSNVVFGFMEKTNPGGSGLAVEFGWAAARGGKALLLVEEQGYPQQRYFGMVRALAHACYEGDAGFELAIADLRFIRDRGVDEYMARLARQGAA
ncbi:hypothetical protein [Burkholderia ubonensis]|uniref:hypothetical protein n=1 Tax=Burkholderia ubonensis TaxID=101571 RepID=UPI000758BE8C|nr:hypothetical protein [Burkholderia ubonensis]